MKMNRIAATALLLTGLINGKAATYLDEPSFLSALGSYTTHDFDGFPDLTPLTSQLSGVTFDNAVIYDVATHPVGGALWSSPNVILNTDLISAITFTFDTPQDAVGFYNTSIVDGEEVNLYDVNNNLIVTDLLPIGVISYWGFISPVPIAWGEIVEDWNSGGNGSIYVDHFSFGSGEASPVPEVTSPAVISAAIVAAGLLKRRRRS